MKTLFTVLMVLATPVQAGTLSLVSGVAEFAQVGSGVWQQRPLPATITSRAGMAGLEYTGGGALLGWTVGAVSFGKATGEGYYVDDDSYNRDTQEITYPCSMCGGRDYKYRADFEQKTEMVYLTANAAYRIGRGSVFIKGGAAFWHATFRLHIYDRIDGVTARTEFREWDTSSYVELGASYARLSVSGYFVPKLRGPESAWDSVSGVKVNYSF